MTGIEPAGERLRGLFALSAKPVNSQGAPELTLGIDKPAFILCSQRQELKRLLPAPSAFPELRTSLDDLARITERRRFAPVLESYDRPRKSQSSSSCLEIPVF